VVAVISLLLVSLAFMIEHQCAGHACLADFLAPG